ncbi:hypothetical protein SLOPH_2295 [Spraguea lophii 42_110]|uniref:RING-CH-type domain-containing protein n=1 Tax=Spraguea lophii (strain 42_110) TaxID=1358809 RepID=S7XGC6_SPRLO|nr:hypothetical protein SLOPH_2295 [Spraguea lophii 42_110]
MINQSHWNYFVISLKNYKTPMDKTCWICFQTDDKLYIRPCICKGDTKFVHKDCFLQYISRNNIIKKNCTVCKYDYQIERKSYAYLTLYSYYMKATNIFLSTFATSILLTIVLLILFFYGIACVAMMNFDINYLFLETYIIHDYLDFLRIVGGFFSIPVYLLKFLYDRRSPDRNIGILPIIFIIDFKGFSRRIHYYIIPVMVVIFTKILSKIIKKLDSHYFFEDNSFMHGEIVIHESSWSIRKIVATLAIPFVGSLIGRIFPFGNLTNSLLGSLFYMFILDSLFILNLFFLKKRNNSILIGNIEEESEQINSDMEDEDDIDLLKEMEAVDPVDLELFEKSLLE